MLREVTSLPSRPAKGPLLTEKLMAMVGSSILMGGSGWGSSSAQKDSPMVIPGIPAMATMSPTAVSAVSSRLRPLKVKSLVTLTGW